MPKLEQLKLKLKKVKGSQYFWPVLITILVVIMVAIALLLVLLPKANFNNPSPKVNVSAKPTPTPYVQTTWTVMITRGIAVPKILKMKKGGTLNILNVAQVPIDIEAADSSSQNTFLDLGTIPFGSMKSVTMPNPGTYQYVNKLNAKVQGSVIVE